MVVQRARTIHTWRGQGLFTRPKAAPIRTSMIIVSFPDLINPVSEVSDGRGSGNETSTIVAF